MCEKEIFLKLSSASFALMSTRHINHDERRERVLMKNLFTADKLEQAKEQAKQKQKQRTARTNQLSNKTVFNSLIYSKQKQAVSETALIDFCLCIASANAAQFHQSQIIELLRALDCKRSSVAKHVRDKSNVFADLISVDSENVFTVENQEFFTELVQLSEFKQQLYKHAHKLYSMFIDEAQIHAEALEMNAERDKSTTKQTARKKTANS